MKIPFSRSVARLLRGRHRGHASASPAEAAPDHEKVEPEMDRKARILSVIDVKGKGIEIGPSHNPVAPKREGFRVDIVDHSNREGLIEKYRVHGVDLEAIEDVDFVWKGTSYRDLTGSAKGYDWIIASHVIEHVPDLIGFLVECDEVMRDGGVLSLAVPDKRFCFDRFRALTGIQALIDARLSGSRNHSAGRIADYFLNVVALSGQIGWSPGQTSGKTMADFGFVHGIADAQSGMRALAENDTYMDIHAWCFTPSSFRLLVEDCHALGMSPLREKSFHAQSGAEFYVALSRDGGGPDIDRRELLRRIDVEIADCIVPG